MQLITRAEANAAGKKRYFTGKPCSQGHVAETYVANYTCTICQCDRLKLFKQDNPEYFLEKNRAYKAANREKVNAASRKWSRENKKYVLANVLKWRTNNPLRIKELEYEWRKRNPHKIKLNTQKWRAANPDGMRIQNHRRRARKRSADGDLTKADISRILNEQSGLCSGLHCRADISRTYTIDHKTALACGGSNDPENIQLLCKSCNSSKNTMSMEEWEAKSIAMMAKAR
jgi:5-methylcytosine-specific restriction endonuclease McrA